REWRQSAGIVLRPPRTVQLLRTQRQDRQAYPSPPGVQAPARLSSAGVILSVTLLQEDTFVAGCTPLPDYLGVNQRAPGMRTEWPTPAALAETIAPPS